MKLIHTADLHLARVFKSFNFSRETADIRRNELWQNLEKTINITIEKEVDLLLICGDIYEREYFTISDIKRFRDMLAKIKNAQVVIISGNHDYISKDSLYLKINWPENIHIFKYTEVSYLEFPEIKTRVYGSSWTNATQRDIPNYSNITLSKDFINIFMGHGSPDSSGEYLPLDLKALSEKGFDYIALGHIHKPMKISERAYYPGSPEPLSFGEMGERGIIYVEFNNGLKVRHIDTAIRKYVECEINIDRNMSHIEIRDKILQTMPSRNNFFRAVLKGNIAEEINVEQLIDGLKQEYFHFEYIDKTSVEIDIEEIYLSNKHNVKGRFIEEMRKRGLESRINSNALRHGLKALEKGEM